MTSVLEPECQIADCDLYLVDSLCKWKGAVASGLSYLEASNEDRRKLPQERVVWNSDSNWGPLEVSSDEGQVCWGEGRVL